MRSLTAVAALATLLTTAPSAPNPAPAPESPVADAAMRRDHVGLRALLQQGADVNAAQGDGMPALHWAATHGDVEEARMLIYAGARVDALTRNGNYTPLHLAAKAGSPTAVRALLDKGATVDAREGAWAQTPLLWASAFNRVPAIQLLLKRGADIAAVSKVEDIPARERADRAANQLRNRRVAALKAAEQPPRPAGAARPDSARPDSARPATPNA